MEKNNGIFFFLDIYRSSSFFVLAAATNQNIE
jgi:hypothetical protein